MSEPKKWKLILHGNEGYPFPLSIETEDGTHWITRDGTVSSLARARLIVRAVNAHDKLVTALQRFIDLDGCRIGTAGPEELRIAMLWARDALALARAEEPHVSRGRCPHCRKEIDPADPYCKCDAQAEKAGE